MGVNGETTVCRQIKYVHLLFSSKMWEEKQSEQQFSVCAAVLRVTAAVAASDMDVQHSESLCCILHMLISFHGISGMTKRDVGAAQETH